MGVVTSVSLCIIASNGALNAPVVPNPNKASTTQSNLPSISPGSSSPTSTPRSSHCLTKLTNKGLLDRFG